MAYINGNNAALKADINTYNEEVNLSDYVLKTLKIAGIDLADDITETELREALNTYPIIFGNGAPVAATVGRTGQLYFDKINKNLYICVGHNNSSYSWFNLTGKIDEQASFVGSYSAAEPQSEIVGQLEYVGSALGGQKGLHILIDENGGRLHLATMDDIEAGGTGADGASAYDIAVANGFEGSETEWLESLKGAKGDKGDTGAQGIQGEKGDKGDTGAQGIQGEKGDAGYTPVKGVDYYTDAERAEFEAYIDEKLSAGNQPEEVFIDVLSEVGYTEKARVNSSGVVKDWENSDVTGYIPVKAGDVIRLKDVYIPSIYNATGDSYGQTVYLYTADKTYIKLVLLCNMDTNENAALDRVIENDRVTQFTLDPTLFGENVAYIIIGAADITAASEIYVNSTIISDNENDIPAYWLAELTAKAETIQQAMETAGRNKSAFLWYTDAHWQTNSKMSPSLLKYLAENTPINKVNFGGDIINDPSEFTHANIKYAYEWRKLIAGLPNHHSVIGNHDVNHNTTDVENMAYAFLLAHEESGDMVTGDGLYYYIDSPFEKTRYLYLSYLTNDHAKMTAQGQFIVDALLNAPENWHIVVIAHRWWQYTSAASPTVGSVPAYEQEILNVFDEYNARTAHTASNYFNTQDFTTGKAKVEFCIGGHIHVDYDFKTGGGIPVIITASDTNQERVSDSDDDCGTVGTTTEAAVYGIIADYNNNKITVVGVGRGTSRVIT